MREYFTQMEAAKKGIITSEMEIVAKKNLCPTFICESAGTQAEDAKQMKDYYLKVK